MTDQCDKLTFLDCATGSNLIAAGMPPGVCVEKWCLDNPEVIISLQKRAVKCHSGIIYAPTFGANRIKLKPFGLENEVFEMNRRLVALSKEAAGEDAKVAGDLTSAGVFIKPFGDMDFSELCDVYFEQTEALKSAGADLIVAETLMSLAEARAAVLAAKRSGLPVYVTLTVDENGRTLSGCSLLPALIALQSMGAAAVGLNCSCGPVRMASFIKEAAVYATVPIIAKPNAGDPGAPLGCDEFAEGVFECIKAGARIVGGCCGTTPEYISAIRKYARDREIPPLPEREEVLCLSSESHVFFMSDETLDDTKPVRCSANLADILFELEDAGAHYAPLEIESPEELEFFTESVYMSRLPVLISSSDPVLLEKALGLYQGRAMISSGAADRNTLIRLAGAYGAYIY